MATSNPTSKLSTEYILDHKDLASCLDLTNSDIASFNANSLHDIPVLINIYWRAIHLDLKDLAILCIISIIDIAAVTQEEVNLVSLTSNIKTLVKISPELTFAYELRVIIYNFLNQKLSAYECSRKLERLGMKLNQTIKKQHSFANILLSLDSYFSFITGDLKGVAHTSVTELLMEYLFGERSEKEKAALKTSVELVHTEPEFAVYTERLIEVVDARSIEIKLNVLSNFYTSIGVTKLGGILGLSAQALKKLIKADTKLNLSKDKKFAIIKERSPCDLKVLVGDIEASMEEVNRMIQEDKENYALKKSSANECDDGFEGNDEELELDDIDRFDDFFSGSEDSF